MRLGIRLGMVILAGLSAIGCSPLALFNGLVPKDGGAVRLASALAYGSNPRQQLDIYAPRRRGAAPVPTILFFYGGSWNSGTRTGYGFVARALAAQGFVVIVPDYRIVPEVRFPAFLEDSAAAVRWAEANAARYGGDGNRVVLVGHSAGAYNAAMLALDPRWLGPARDAVRGFVGLAGPYDFLPLEGPVTTVTFGAWPNPRETQPIDFAGAGAPPVLLLTGRDDTTVRPRNSEALAARLAAVGVAAEVREYAGVGHIGILTSLARPFRGNAPALADIVRFVRHVSALPAPSRRKMPDG